MRTSPRKIFIVVGATLLLVSLACSSEGTATSTPRVAGIAQGAATETAQPEVADQATKVPTDTTEPTATKEPTATTIPGLLQPGTYVVGEDIQPGIYAGLAGSGLSGMCYWARLADLSGGSDSILANDIPNGRYYLEVKSTDMALETKCPIIPLDSVKPYDGGDTVEPGMYLVGVDIQPGRYKGMVGSDEMCYWSRLRDVSGGSNSIIANDIPTGQYYVEIKASDYAFNTKCEVSLAGQ